MSNKAANETSQNEEIVYVIDAGSGWEQDDDLVWIIDEANEAEWENQAAYIWTEGTKETGRGQSGQTPPDSLRETIPWNIIGQSIVKQIVSIVSQASFSTGRRDLATSSLGPAETRRSI